MVRRYQLTEVGKEAKAGVVLFLKNPIRRRILAFMHKRPRRGWTWPELQKELAFPVSKGEATFAAEYTTNVARELRKMAKEGLINVATPKMNNMPIVEARRSRIRITPKRPRIS